MSGFQEKQITVLLVLCCILLHLHAVWVNFAFLLTLSCFRSLNREELQRRFCANLNKFAFYFIFSSKRASQKPPILYCFSCVTYQIFVGLMSLWEIPYLANAARALDMSLKNALSSLVLNSHLCFFLN